MKHRIRITSLFAMSDPESDRPFTWEGIVPMPENVVTDEEICEAVFRLFNRVDQADADRLEEWGYRLPSLSVGDIVGIDRGPYFDLHRVESAGFKRVFPGLSL